MLNTHLIVGYDVEGKPLHLFDTVEGKFGSITLEGYIGYNPIDMCFCVRTFDGVYTCNASSVTELKLTDRKFSDFESKRKQAYADSLIRSNILNHVCTCKDEGGEWDDI